MNIINCDACNKQITNPETAELVNLIGISITVHDDTQDKINTEYMQSQLGPYKIGKTYSICYECWLKSLGVPVPSAHAGEG